MYDIGAVAPGNSKRRTGVNGWTGGGRMGGWMDGWAVSELGRGSERTDGRTRRTNELVSECVFVTTTTARRYRVNPFRVFCQLRATDTPRLASTAGRAERGEVANEVERRWREPSREEEEENRHA